MIFACLHIIVNLSICLCFILGFSGSGMLSPAGSCQCLLWTGLSEQIQSPDGLLSGAEGKHVSLFRNFN